MRRALAACAALLLASCDDGTYLGPFTVELPAADGGPRAAHLVVLPDVADGVLAVGDHRVRLDAIAALEGGAVRHVTLFLADGAYGDASAPRLAEVPLALPPGGTTRELAVDEDTFRDAELALSVARGETDQVRRADPVTRLLVGLEGELPEGEVATLTFTLRVRE